MSDADGQLEQLASVILGALKTCSAPKCWDRAWTGLFTISLTRSSLGRAGRAAPALAVESQSLRPRSGPSECHHQRDEDSVRSDVVHPDVAGHPPKRLLVLLALGAACAAWKGPAAERSDRRTVVEYIGLIIALSVLTRIPVPIEALASTH
jgi:hypothetical protein